mgnify:CR=1 FL=1
MNKIWYRNPSKLEVIGRCGGDGEKRMTTQNRQMSNAKKKKIPPRYRDDHVYSIFAQLQDHDTS